MWYAVVCFFFKQKTAYEMRISDWSSDVCSSDLELERGCGLSGGLSPSPAATERLRRQVSLPSPNGRGRRSNFMKWFGRKSAEASRRPVLDRKSVVQGKSVSVRVDLGGCRNI